MAHRSASQERQVKIISWQKGVGQSALSDPLETAPSRPASFVDRGSAPPSVNGNNRPAALMGGGGTNQPAVHDLQSTENNPRGHQMQIVNPEVGSQLSSRDKKILKTVGGCCIALVATSIIGSVALGVVNDNKQASTPTGTTNSTTLMASTVSGMKGQQPTGTASLTSSQAAMLSSSTNPDVPHGRIPVTTNAVTVSGTVRSRRNRVEYSNLAMASDGSVPPKTTFQTVVSRERGGRETTKGFLNQAATTSRSPRPQSVNRRQSSPGPNSTVSRSRSSSSTSNGRS